MKKTISLPAALAREAEARARAEGKTLSGVIQEALRQSRIGRRQQELRDIQGYWSRKARDQGILSELDLERYLRAQGRRLRVVFDTNILVAALVFPGGRGEEALQRILDERDELLLSRPILDELLGVLARKFARDAEALARVAVFLGGLSTQVRPGRRLKILKDDADNRILECALAGRADAIVTGDKAFLALREHGGVRILSLADYLS